MQFTPLLGERGRNLVDKRIKPILLRFSRSVIKCREGKEAGDATGQRRKSASVRLNLAAGKAEGYIPLRHHVEEKVLWSLPAKERSVFGIRSIRVVEELSLFSRIAEERGVVVHMAPVRAQ